MEIAVHLTAERGHHHRTANVAPNGGRLITLSQRRKMVRAFLSLLYVVLTIASVITKNIISEEHAQLLFKMCVALHFFFSWISYTNSKDSMKVAQRSC